MNQKTSSSPARSSNARRGRTCARGVWTVARAAAGKGERDPAAGGGRRGECGPRPGISCGAKLPALDRRVAWVAAHQTRCVVRTSRTESCARGGTRWRLRERTYALEVQANSSEGVTLGMGLLEFASGEHRRGVRGKARSERAILVAPRYVDGGRCACGALGAREREARSEKLQRSATEAGEGERVPGSKAGRLTRPYMVLGP